MSNFNKVILLGNLTRDPEIRYTLSGTAVTDFGIAVNYRYKQDKEVKEEVSYVDIVVFGKQAESSAEHLRKGKAVLIDGRLKQRFWETQDGRKKNKFEIIANSVQFLDNPKDLSEG